MVNFDTTESAEECVIKWAIIYKALLTVWVVWRLLCPIENNFLNKLFIHMNNFRFTHFVAAFLASGSPPDVRHESHPKCSVLTGELRL